MNVIAVDHVGDNQARWTFDTDIASFVPDTIAGMQINGEDVTTTEGSSGPIITVDYADEFSSGNPWEVTAGFSGITFVGRLTLGPQTGTVN